MTSFVLNSINQKKSITGMYMFCFSHKYPVFCLNVIHVSNNKSHSIPAFSTKCLLQRTFWIFSSQSFLFSVWSEYLQALKRRNAMNVVSALYHAAPSRFCRCVIFVRRFVLFISEAKLFQCKMMKVSLNFTNALNSIHNNHVQTGCL